MILAMLMKFEGRAKHDWVGEMKGKNVFKIMYEGMQIIRL